MLNLQQFTNIQEALQRTASASLADQLEFMPHRQLEAIALMAESMQSHSSMLPTEIASCIEHDVVGFLENKEGFKPHCEKWLIDTSLTDTDNYLTHEN